MNARLSLICLLFAGLLAARAPGQDTQPSSEKKAAAETATTNAPNATNTAPAIMPEASVPASTPSVAAESPVFPTLEKGGAGTNVDSQSKTNKAAGPDEIQVSFQGANIDMIVQWLAQTTGKSVVKHPQAQCQLTIMSSKKVSTREAINLVYRALALEGFSAIESSNSILIVPEGKEPKMNPELLDASRKDIPEGRQRLVKIFSLSHIQAAELREKVRGVLSDKGTIDTDERANQLIVTDYNDNLRLLSDLIKEFDVSASGMVIEIRPLKHADADELANLLGLILSAQAGGASAPPKSSRSSSSGPSLPPGMSSMPGSPSPPGVGGSSGGDSSPPASSSGSQGGSSGQQVRLWPDKSSNRLIISAPKSKLPEVLRLIDILDTDKPEDVALRVIPLKNVNAADLAKELGPLYQKTGGRSPRETVEVAANDRSNSLIVLSSETNFKAIEKLVTALDTKDALEKATRTFLLKNADAQDVAKQLQDLNKDQDASSRYPYFIFSSSGSSAKGSKKMSVVADRRRNCIIVQAPPAQMEEIEKMIQELDEPVSDDSLAPRIYPLKYVSAVDIEDVLNELFLKKTQQRSYFDYYDNPEPQADRDVGRLYGKVRITSEPYANAIIVTSNSKENLAVVEDVLKQLDQPSEAGESTLRIGLKFAKAFTVANNINILFAKNGSPPLRAVNQQQPQGNQTPQQQQQRAASQPAFELERAAKEDGYFPWLGGQPDAPRSSDGRTAVRSVSDLVGRVRAVADERSNALLISANVHFFPQVLKLIEELDAPTDQVLIEARLVEVSSDFLDKLGVRWSPDGSQVFSADDYQNSILANSTARYMQGFGGSTAVNTPNADAVAQTLTTLRSGVLSSTINMDFLIQFLRRTTDARILAEPQINIRDNETGRLFVGQQIPTLTASQNAGSIGLSQNFEYKDVGVILEVTPHINNTGDVELKIHAESSVVVAGETILGGAVFDTRNFRTDLTAKNGQTLVLGGIIQKQVTDTLYKTPILGEIPGLKWLFNKKDKSSHEVELMVFLRPKVTRTPQDAQDLMNEIYDKAPNVKKWKDELHLQKDAQPSPKENRRPLAE
jgi:general secretion pathway protein D